MNDMNYITKGKNFYDIKVFIIILLYTIIVLFFLSEDSFLHNVYYRTDSAIFFASGKAWMNGLTPYVDFADSKGPLLWLIYGIGYLISNTSYLGIYFISCIYYSVTLFFCFKLVKLFLNNTRESLFISFLMIFFYFFSKIHYEVRAEDFCQPFIISSLYYLIKTILSPSQISLKKAGFAIGLGIIGSTLIKWSIALTSGIFLLSALLIAIKGKMTKKFLLFFLYGILSLAIPFGIYFIIDGNFNEFINEYFLNTAKSVNRFSKLDTVDIYSTRLLKLFTSCSIIFILYILGALLLYLKDKRITIIPVLTATFFILVSSVGGPEYYLNICSSFALFLIIYLYQNFKLKASICLIAISGYVFYYDTFKVNFFLDKTYRKDFYDISYIISQVENPTIINEGYENGLGLCANAIPGTKYWTRQNGETREMRESRRKAIKEGKADFVTIVYPEKYYKDPKSYILNGTDYIYYASIRRSDNSTIKLFGRPGLKMPSKSFQMSNTDVFFKRVPIPLE